MFLRGKPQELKQVNLSSIRRVIKEWGTATRAEIVSATQISITTVRALINELTENGEIIELGFDESIGGRKAVRYKLNKERFLGASFCVLRDSIQYNLVNICGEVLASGELGIKGGAEKSICDFLQNAVAKNEIKSIGIGVPGIIDGLCYKRQNQNRVLETIRIGEEVFKRFNIPVILENDVNAMTLGVGRRYLRDNPILKCVNLNIVYLNFEKDCIKAGLLCGGRIVRGASNFAGELGLLPSGNGILNESISKLSEEEFNATVKKLLNFVCCFINPQAIALGGTALPKNFQLKIENLSKDLTPKIYILENAAKEYMEGLAYLTAENIFSNVQIVRE